MLKEFKNYKKAIVTAEKNSGVYCKGVISDPQLWNLFSKFRSGDTSLMLG